MARKTRDDGPLPAAEDAARPHADRSTADLLRGIALDSATLVRKEVELAKLELKEAMAARVKGAAGLAVAGVLGLIALVYLGTAAASALSGVMPGWAAWLVTAGAFLLVAGAAAAAGMARMKSASTVPGGIRRRVKEDVGWAREQLKR
ncbi:MAG: phage holin family protein [Actinobacteria bacterium]|nr:phage holin family protein [Actinomycetota bacterium]